jgi:hypothetical protein
VDSAWLSVVGSLVQPTLECSFSLLFPEETVELISSRNIIESTLAVVESSVVVSTSTSSEEELESIVVLSFANVSFVVLSLVNLSLVVLWVVVSSSGIDVVVESPVFELVSDDLFNFVIVVVVVSITVAVVVVSVVLAVVDVESALKPVVSTFLFFYKNNKNWIRFKFRRSFLLGQLFLCGVNQLEMTWLIEL